MKLIADSGSTKTDWCLIDNAHIVCQFKTEGINPFVQTDAMITPVLSSAARQLLGAGDRRERNGQMVSQHSSLDEIHFYGSGIRPEMQPRMEKLLSDAFGFKGVKGVKGFKEVKGVEELHTTISLSRIPLTICTYSDLLGAARALCGNNEGIVCILGTGSNSCLYDGREIVANIPPLGYILGDEGSGAVLGKMFIGALFKHQLPETLRQQYLDESRLQLSDIIDRVYRQPLPNRWLAATTPFIHRHLDCEPLQQLVIDNFRAFLRRNVHPYCRPALPVNAIGGMAHYFAPQFRQALELEQLTCGTILQSPMPGLIAFHSRTNR